MRSLKFILPVFALILVLAIAGYEIFFSPAPVSSAGSFVLIRLNTNAHEVAQTLTRMKIIHSPTRFVRFARLFGYDKRIKPGRYFLPPGSNELGILKIISTLRCSHDRVTIPEGLTVKDIGRILEENGVSGGAEFESAAARFKNPRLPNAGAEGYLFPDTYNLPVGLGARATIEIMVARFFEVYDRLIKENGISDPDPGKTVILASIVEKEAKLDRERPIIASVFLNRLKIRMRLESCSTVEYALPEHKPTLSYADLKVSSPYNTYIQPGLPPGPICNPGQPSLKAALMPSPTDYLYFVAQGDGSHKFSKTFSEHIQAKNRNANVSNGGK